MDGGVAVLGALIILLGFSDGLGAVCGVPGST